MRVCGFEWDEKGSLPLLIERESDAFCWPNFPENRYKVRFQYVYKRENR